MEGRRVDCGWRSQGLKASHLYYAPLQVQSGEFPSWFENEEVRLSRVVEDVEIGGCNYGTHIERSRRSFKLVNTQYRDPLQDYLWFDIT